MSRMTKAKREDRDEAVATLREWVKPGDKLRTLVVHRSKSGMLRAIRVFRVYAEKGEAHMHDISHMVARALDYRVHQDRGGVVMTGCGMDMGFALVYNLGRTLFPEGGPLDKSNAMREMQAKRADKGATVEKDGGYLLKHEWL